MDGKREPGLTGKARAAGCAAKIGPGDLQALLQGIEIPADERVLVGLAKPDDAGVFLLSPGLALVQTVDMITPVADRPFDYGRIAATNAMSDVWAMGGRPLTALAIITFPVKSEPPETFRGMLEGAIAAVTEAGAALVGGHSVDDPEIKLGISVTGVVDPDRLITKGGARPGDVLVLTKPLGVGVISTALKNGAATGEQADAAIASMSRLNRAASEEALAAGVRGGTDVTGFSLMGHLREMVLAAGCGAEVRFDALPLLPGARALAAEGWSPGGMQRNLDFAGCLVDGLDALSPGDVAILFDPQTSGGLLLAVPPAEVDGLVARLAARDVTAAIIGRFTARSAHPRVRAY